MPTLQDIRRSRQIQYPDRAFRCSDGITYRLDTKIFPDRVRAIDYLVEQGFTVMEAVNYLRVLNRDA